jgi:hypothetical protein
MAPHHRPKRERALVGLIITPDDPGNFSSPRVFLGTIADDVSIESSAIDTEAKGARITSLHRAASVE